jgi:hypothetical protein
LQQPCKAAIVAADILTQIHTSTNPCGYASLSNKARRQVTNRGHCHKAERQCGVHRYASGRLLAQRQAAAQWQGSTISISRSKSMRFILNKGPVAAAIALLCGSALAQETVVLLGHVAPMSGEQAQYGQDNANGAILAVEDLNAKGVTIGGKKVKFDLLNEDDGADPKQATAVAYKLVDAKVNGGAWRSLPNATGSASRWTCGSMRPMSMTR